jgi:catechol 2,3-dioxygenase-like lactoylglutathione lyase family enzyme
MHLGAFSVSLAVKDIAASRTFYEALGFNVFSGDQEAGWLILKSVDTILGLFQGMFDRNMLTFNPGWDQDAQELDTFMDIRAIQARLKEAGLTLEVEADMASEGPAELMLLDPDGNPVLIDQHR